MLVHFELLAGTQLTEDEYDAMLKLLQDNKVKMAITRKQMTFEKLQKLLREQGHEELAKNLRAKLDTGV